MPSPRQIGAIAATAVVLKPLAWLIRLKFAAPPGQPARTRFLIFPCVGALVPMAVLHNYGFGASAAGVTGIAILLLAWRYRLRFFIDLLTAAGAAVASTLVLAALAVFGVLSVQAINPMGALYRAGEAVPAASISDRRIVADLQRDQPRIVLAADRGDTEIDDLPVPFPAPRSGSTSRLPMLLIGPCPEATSTAYAVSRGMLCPDRRQPLAGEPVI